MTLPFTLPRWAWALAGLAAVLLILWALRADAYRDGVKAERTRWEQKIARDKAAQAERERIADQNLQQQLTRDQAAADERTKEIDRATANLPDQAPSARQRSRACIELVREAKAAGRNPPAC